jgi:hypothetical protein
LNLARQADLLRALDRGIRQHPLPQGNSHTHGVGGNPHNGKEPPKSAGEANLAAHVFLPTIPIALLVADSILKLNSFVLGGDGSEWIHHLISFVLILVIAGLAYHAMTAVQPIRTAVTEAPILQFPKAVRLGALAALAISLVFWGTAATRPPSSDLTIASLAIPQPDERRLELVLVNKASKSLLLTGFDVESRLYNFLYCLSYQPSIPIVGQYTVPFKIFSLRTTILLKPEEVRAFEPSKSGRIEVVLQPGATGFCSDKWKADIRVLVASDDGRRSARISADLLWTHTRDSRRLLANMISPVRWGERSPCEPMRAIRWGSSCDLGFRPHRGSGEHSASGFA